MFATRERLGETGRDSMTIATTTRFLVVLVLATVAIGPNRVSGSELKPIGYNNPGLVVDLGVCLWAWPLPMDFDGDGEDRKSVV